MYRSRDTPRPTTATPNLMNNSAGAHFLATAGIPLLMGRDFAESDTAASPKVAIVNESLAKRVFRGKKPHWLPHHV